MPVRVSPVSRLAAVLIMALGLFTILGGYGAGLVEDEVAGVAFFVLGVALYLLLYRLAGKIERELQDGQDA